MVNQAKTLPAGATRSPGLSPKSAKGLIGICNDSGSGRRIQGIINNEPAVSQGARIERPIMVTKEAVA
jgi:hypothetical protein